MRQLILALLGLRLSDVSVSGLLSHVHAVGGPPDWALPLHAAQSGRVYDCRDRVDDMLFVPTDKL